MKLLKVLLILFALGLVAFFALNLFKGQSIFDSAEGLIGPKLPAQTDKLREQDRKELENILNKIPARDD